VTIWYWSTIPKVRYSKSPLCRYAPVLTFGLGLGLWVRSALALGLGLVGIVDFRNSGPESTIYGITAFLLHADDVANIFKMEALGFESTASSCIAYRPKILYRQLHDV